MDWIVESAVSNAVVATGLAVVVWLAGLAIKRPALLHALWVLVLLKLLTPPVVRVPLPWMVPGSDSSPASAARHSAAPAPTELDANVPPGGSRPLEPEARGPEAAFGSGAGRPVDPVPLFLEGRLPSFTWPAILLGVWLAGTVLSISLFAVRTLRFRSILARAPRASPETEEEAAALCRRLGVRRCPGLFMTPEPVSPALWAFGRWRIVLPSDLWSRLEPAARVTLLAHELAHVARRDPWVRWIETAATAFYWWLPVVWIARRQARIAEEAACDARVVSALPGKAGAYARALVETVEYLAGGSRALPALGMGMAGARSLGRRLAMIVEGGIPGRMTRSGWIGVASAALIVLPFVPVPGQAGNEDRAREEAERPPEKPAPPGPDRPSRIVPMSPAGRGKAVSIKAGEVEIVDVLRFIADYTGTAVTFESGGKRNLLVATTMTDVTSDVAVALFKAHGFYVHHVKTEDGDTFYRIGPREVPIPGSMPESKPSDGRNADATSGVTDEANSQRGVERRLEKVESKLDAVLRELEGLKASGAKSRTAAARRAPRLPARDAIPAALDWLLRHQSADGSWKARDFTERCAAACRLAAPGPGDGRGLAEHDAGVTGLAMLALTGWLRIHGANEEHHRSLEGAAAYLQSVQVRSDDPALNGRYGKGGGEQWIYSHAIATRAMCELLLATRDANAIRDSAAAAVELCLRAQNDGSGWRYGIRPGENDTSVTGWMVLALDAARRARLDVPAARFEASSRGALGWIQRVTSASGKTGYMAPGDEGSRFAGAFPDPYPFSKELPCMTAVGVLCRLLLGTPRKDDAVRRGVELLEASPPVWQEATGNRLSTVNFGYWYHGTYALLEHAGSPSAAWKAAVENALLDSQRRTPGSCEHGSWDPVDEWGQAGGRVYSTAMAALSLELCETGR